MATAAEILEQMAFPPQIAVAYRKVELLMQADKYTELSQILKSTASKLTREELDTLIGCTHHPLLRPGAIKILMENCRDQG